MASIPSEPSITNPPSVTFVTSESVATPISIPAYDTTLAGFRQWALSEDFPERGKITFVDGGVIVDRSPESLENHSDVKTEISRVLSILVREQNLGRLHIDGVLISNVAAGVSNEPDILYLAKETVASGRTKLTQVLEQSSKSSKEVVGTVDWVLEIVGPSSVRKDKVQLRKAYFEARIGEYWIVDVRGEAIEFDVLVPGKDGFESVEPSAGWYASPTFGRAFQLTREQEADGYWLYTLGCKES